MTLAFFQDSYGFEIPSRDSFFSAPYFFHNKDIGPGNSPLTRKNKPVSPDWVGFFISRSPWGASEGNAYRSLSPIEGKPVLRPRKFQTVIHELKGPDSNRTNLSFETLGRHVWLAIPSTFPPLKTTSQQILYILGNSILSTMRICCLKSTN